MSFSLVDEAGETACATFATNAARDGVTLRITGQSVVLDGARRPVDIDLIALP